MSDMAGAGVGCNLHRYTGSNLRLLKMYVIPFCGLEEHETKVIASKNHPATALVGWVKSCVAQNMI